MIFCKMTNQDKIPDTKFIFNLNSFASPPEKKEINITKTSTVFGIIFHGKLYVYYKNQTRRIYSLFNFISFPLMKERSHTSLNLSRHYRGILLLTREFHFVFTCRYFLYYLPVSLSIRNNPRIFIERIKFYNFL